MTEALIKDSLISLTTAMAAPNSAAAGAAAAATASAGGTAAQAAQVGQITRALETLDTLFARERRHLHPQLAHFLQHRSYAKALAFLGGPAGDIPPSARRPQRQAGARAGDTAAATANTRASGSPTS